MAVLCSSTNQWKRPMISEEEELQPMVESSQWQWKNRRVGGMDGWRFAGAGGWFYTGDEAAEAIALDAPIGALCLSDSFYSLLAALLLSRYRDREEGRKEEEDGAAQQAQ